MRNRLDVTCPYCGATASGPLASASPVVCPQCQNEIPVLLIADAEARTFPGAPARDVSRRPVGTLLLVLLGGGLVAFGILLGFVWGRQGRTVDPPPVAAQPASQPAPSAGSVPKEEGDAAATFEFHSIRDTSIGSLFIYGVVRNTSQVTIGKPEVIAVLRDSAGRELTTENGYALDDEIAPGASSPVSILLSNPPRYDSITYEVIASRSTYALEPSKGLRIEPTPPEEGSLGAYEFKGLVQNDGDRPARFIQITVLGLDGRGRIVGIGQAYAKTETLAPGASARYHVTSTYFGSVPAKFDYSVSGNVAPEESE